MPTENRSSNTELSKIVTEALVAMVSSVTGMRPPADEPLPGFIQAPIDRAVERIAAQLAQPAAQHQGEPVFMVRSHGSCCWEESNGEGLDIALSMPDEYEVRKLYLHPAASDGFSAGDMADQGAKAFAARDGEVELLRAQLDRRNELLERMKSMFLHDEPHDLYDAVCSVLSDKS